MDDIYNNQSYLEQNPLWHQEDAAYKAGFIFELLQRNHISFQTVGEVGCGSGAVLEELSKCNNNKTINYFGFDISKDAINIANKRSNSNLSFYLKDITDSSNTDLFDVLLVVDVIEHLPNYFSFLEAIQKKSTHTVFHIPLDMFVWSLFRENMLIESKKRVGHIHNFSEDFILSVIEDNGFNIIDKQYTEPDYTSSSFKQRIVNTLKKLLFKISPRFCSKTLGGYSIMVLCKN
ncbi:MAG: class I SAM-dependent methyltransferase [Sphingobacteriaceae bacterium]|jgi:SAM-dependent methyltransferase